MSLSSTGIKLPRWRRLDPFDPPSVQGIYCIKSGNSYLYIGRSVNIKQRFRSRQHPVWVALSLDYCPVTFFWFPWNKLSPSLAKIESFAIKRHEPQWNGGTSFECRGTIGAACKWHSPIFTTEVIEFEGLLGLQSFTVRRYSSDYD